MFTKNQLIQQYKKHINDNSNNFIKKDGVRIMSYNIQMFKDINNKLSFDKLKKIINDSSADVIMLLEALFVKNYKTLFEEMICKTEYKYIKYANDKFGINILLSKYPIIKSQVIRLVKDTVKKMNRYAITATIEINNKFLKIAGCHLDVFDETEETRKQQILEILDKIDNEYILLGDLNSLRKKDYDDCEWSDLVKDCILRNTNAHTLVTDLIEKHNFIDCWNFINKISPKITVLSMRRVYYIYIGNKFKYSINQCNLLINDASDHFALYVDIKM